jgi:hypothetical protein
MKSNKRLLVVAIAVLVGSLANSAVAHEKMELKSGGPERTIGIAIQPLTALFGAYIVNPEFKISDGFSIWGQLAFVDTDLTIKSGYNKQPGWFIEAGIGPKYYITGSALCHGLYIEQLMMVSYGRTFDGMDNPAFNFGEFGIQPVQANMWILSTQTHIGYMYVNSWGLMVDAYMGLVGYVAYGYPNSGGYALDTLHLWAGGRVGYAW